MAAPEQEVIAIDDYLDALGVPLDYTRALDYFHGRVMQANVSAAGLALAVEALRGGTNCENRVTFSERSYAHCSMYRYVHPRTFDSILQCNLVRRRVPRYAPW